MDPYFWPSYLARIKVPYQFPMGLSLYSNARTMNLVLGNMVLNLWNINGQKH